MKDAFNQLISNANKAAPVPESIGKYVDALVKGTHQISSVTITPKSAWVGLTDEEIERACVPLGAAMLSFTEVARAIEAKLREKNT
jgi:pyruvate/2-oxoglutarate dehydrogenase complex dihydrolipoamide dehydrogenase (E3) component